MEQLYLIPLGLLVALYLIFASFFTVNTAQVAVITGFGKFLRVAEPGLNWKRPFFDSVAGMVSLRVNQITLTMETKTKDNVLLFLSPSRIAFALKKSMTLTTSWPILARRSNPMWSK